MSAMTISGSGNDIFKSYSQLASGKKINSAADDAAGLAIAKKMQREETGLCGGRCSRRCYGLPAENP